MTKISAARAAGRVAAAPKRVLRARLRGADDTLRALLHDMGGEPGPLSCAAAGPPPKGRQVNSGQPRRPLFLDGAPNKGGLRARQTDEGSTNRAAPRELADVTGTHATDTRLRYLLAAATEHGTRMRQRPAQYSDFYACRDGRQLFLSWRAAFGRYDDRDPGAPRSPYQWPNTERTARSEPPS
jgi:hypothetical protein